MTIKYFSFKKLITLPLATLLLASCGGNSNSDSKAKVTFTVDDILSSQKKAKDSSDISEVSVTDINGNNAGEAKEIEPRKYEVKVDKDTHIVIKIKLVNKNGEITLERIIENSKSEDVTVDQSSTTVASLIRESATENNQGVKEYLDNHEGDTDKANEIINNIENNNLINDLLTTGSEQDLASITKALENALKDLEKIKKLLELIKAHIADFQNGIKTTDSTNSDVTLEHVADQIDSSNHEEHNGTSINIDENGDIFVIKGDEVSNVTTDTNIAKEPIVSGEVNAVNADMIELVIKTDKGPKEVKLLNKSDSATLIDLLKNIHPGDHITVKFEENDQGDKVIVKISGSGKTVGILTEKNENSVTLLDEHGNSTTFTAKYIAELETTATTSNVKKNQKGGFDPAVLKIISTLSIKDKVVVKWEINEKKRIIAMEKITESTDPVVPPKEEPKPPVEEPKPPVDNSTEGQKITLSGSVVKKGDVGFSLQLSANSEPTFVTINNDIAYHKEILASLLIGDAITVVIHKKDSKYILDNATGDGVMSGTLIEKTETAIWVKNADGLSVKFTPEWHDGGLDATILAQFKELAVGTSITVKWKLEERKRAISISKN